MTRISHTTAGVRISAIKEMAMRSAKVADAVSLAWGLPSFATPPHIRAAVAEALESDPDIGKYALPDGLPALRDAVADTHRKRWGVEVDPATEVVITAGNMQGINALLHVALDPGDEVIVTDPGFASHFQQIRLCGGVPVGWQLREEAGWALDVERLPALVGPRTRAIVLVSPSNPTGTIFSREALLRTAEIAAAHDLWILVDDPYSALTYENRERYFNLASRPELRERVVYLFTFSKCYAMSGWRLGYMVVPPGLKGEVLKVHDATLICAPRISQVAALAGLRGSDAHLAEFERVLGARRRLICERLDRVPHVFEYVLPDGAYYVFPRIVTPHEDSWSFSLDLLHRARVAVTPGEAFGAAGRHHVRMAFCVEDDAIELAFDRIERHFPA